MVNSTVDGLPWNWAIYGISWGITSVDLLIWWSVSLNDRRSSSVIIVVDIVALIDNLLTIITGFSYYSHCLAFLDFLSLLDFGFFGHFNRLHWDISSLSHVLSMILNNSLTWLVVASFLNMVHRSDCLFLGLLCGYCLLSYLIWWWCVCSNSLSVLLWSILVIDDHFWWDKTTLLVFMAW